MLFNSIEFLIFFCVVVGAYFLIANRFRWMLLLAASYAFYMSWNPSYVLLILLSTVVDYFVALRIRASPDRTRRRGWLLASLATNLGLLFTFKYWGFFHENMARLCHALGLPYQVPELDVLLPVGISFYTFQTLSYTLDVYRGSLEPVRHFGRFALFVSFFPQLVAGPIERAANLLPQFEQRVRFDYERVCSGMQLMLWGLFKKVVIADRLSIYVDAVYGNVEHHNGATFLLATWAFAFQIYCDFSGYSDIAIGTARVLGFDLMKNFERPYFSRSITEFWRRWHISLSSWLRDYLYISLGGNRAGTILTYRNLLITMLLGGVWHGASWNFVIWGAFHGVLLAASRATMPWRDQVWERTGAPGWLRDGWRMLVTFQLVCLGWIFFRAATVHDSRVIVTRLFSDWGAPFLDLPVLLPGALFVGLLLAVQVMQERVGSLRVWLAPRPVGH